MQVQPWIYHIGKCQDAHALAALELWCPAFPIEDLLQEHTIFIQKILIFAKTRIKMTNF